MTEAPIETEPHETPPANWSKKAWRVFASWVMGTTTRLNVLIGFAFVGLGFWLVYNQIDALNRDAISESESRTEQDLFQIRLANYGRDVADFTICVRAAELSAANRGQWEIAVERIEQLGGDEFAEVLANGPLLSTPPRSASECVDPGEPPVPPD